ncbi:glutamate receptor ionotropic, kainate 2-like [Coccinella septempunctata]|uniref:glutamate receptor ionotropic, kainate 2-like n=1 Tax=Coccinella septempunctata TaxID=41139 RepID=UPI001D094778|nr:glutamate receptor ionotropic, kainate 2-like [Coccinella septempunctata]
MIKKSWGSVKCCIFLILICRASGDHVIGGIFDEDHEENKKAFEIAIELVNLQRNDDQQLKPVIEILEPYNMFQASSKACQLLEFGAITIFGPYNPDNFEAIQSVCDAKEVPVIQTRWNHRPQRDSSIMNFHPHPTQLSMAYVEIIKKFDWKQFILFYDDDESFLRLLDLMKLSHDNSYLIVTRQLDPDDTGVYRDQFREIADSPVNNIVIDCRLEVLQEVLRQAQQLGLMNRNYNYFITNLDFHTIDLEPFQYSNTNITGVKLLRSDLKMTEDFTKEMCKSEESGNEAHTKDCSLKTSSALIADAMFMLSDAMSNLEEGTNPANEGHSCNDTNAWEYGSSLVNIIRTIRIEGRTGMVKFDNEGFRSDFTLILTEVQERGLVDIGYWNMSEGVQIQRPLPYPQSWEDDDEEEDPTSLVNKTLIVITALTEPYTFLKDSSEKLIGNDRYEGFGVDLIDEMAKLEKFNYIIILREDKSNGAKNSRGQWSGMIGDLINKTADLAIADLTINSERAEAVDFTTPFMELGIKILFQKPTAAPPNFFSFAEPFAIDTWISIGISYVFVSLSLFIMGRLSASEWTNPFPCIEEPEYLINQFSLSNSFWFSTGTGLQQGTEIAPIAVSTRMVAGMWWFFILLMVASYTANLAAFLATTLPLKLFTDVESLVKNAAELEIRYGAKANGATEKFFKDSKDHEIYGQVYRHMQEHKEDMPSDNNLGVLLAEKEKYAFFMESTSIEYATERHCGLEMYGDYLDRKGYGIAMRKNSTYRSRLSTTILRLQSAGIIDDLKRRWWQERRGGGQCVTNEDDGDAKPLGMSNLEGVFFVTVYGLIVGYAFAVLERLAYVISISRKTKMPFLKALIYEMKFYANFESNVKPVLGSNANLAEGEDQETELAPAKPYGFINNSNEKLDL